MAVAIDSTRPPLDELARQSAAFEHASAEEIIAWAWERFGESLVATCSFEDAVLPHLVSRAAPSTDVVLLDTQYLFAETLWFAEEVRSRYGVNFRVVSPDPSVQPDNLWQRDVEACCQLRKVEPLNRTLAAKSAWITGIRRVDAPTRANAPIVSWDIGRNLVRINPIATWSDDDIATYSTIHELLVNPLSERGYPSIGCWPCTRPVMPGEDRRAGSWSGSGKVECGLHT